MRQYLRWSTVLAAAGVSAGKPRPPATLRFEPRDILEAVASDMNVSLRPDVPVPEVLLESTTPLQRFQDAISAQWGFRPHVYANAYAISTNEIYLMDDASYYARRKRTLDDSLAHEFAHYIQVRYLNADLSDPSYEIDAVALQDAFRERHAAPTYVAVAFKDLR
jgi:hypothetical protein